MAYDKTLLPMGVPEIGTKNWNLQSSMTTWSPTSSGRALPLPLTAAADDGSPQQPTTTMIAMIVFIAMPSSHTGMSYSFGTTAITGSAAAIAAGQSQSTGHLATTEAMTTVAAV
jgi:hypothetical protein